MLIQIILSIIEDSILSFFIARTTKVKKQVPFIITSTFICSLMTNVFNYYEPITEYLPLAIFLTNISLLKYFKVKINFNIVIWCILAPILIILTDLIALLLFSFYAYFNITIITNNQQYITYASFLAKILFLMICILILNIQQKNKNILSFKTWGILLPIYLSVFFSIYILGNAIVSNTLNNHSILLLINIQVILSVLIIVLYYIIQKESLNIKKIELNAQKEKYIKQNKSLMLTLHDEISTIDHNNMYTLLSIKNLLNKNNLNEINGIIDKKIYELKKYKNIIYSGNPYFDQVFNREINNYCLLGKDIKIMCLISNSDFEINQLEMDYILDILKYLISISSVKPFTIDINDKLKFLNISFIFYSIKDIEKNKLTNLKKIYSTDKIKYQYTNNDHLICFKLIMETSL